MYLVFGNQNFDKIHAHSIYVLVLLLIQNSGGGAYEAREA